MTKKKISITYSHFFVFLLFLSIGKCFAQHSLQLDFGGAYSVIKGSNPGGTFTLPPGGGTLLTTNSGLVWLTQGNPLSGVDGTNNVLGSLAGAALLPVNIIVNGNRVMRYDGAATVNIIGGYQGNIVDAGAVGVIIAGGGRLFQSEINHATSNASYGNIGGGLHNTIDGFEATVGGGGYNVSTSQGATVAGGLSNSATAAFGTVGGGNGNSADFYSTVSGGSSNKAISSWNAVGGGFGNTAGNLSGSAWSFVGGGSTNFASGYYCVVGGGNTNTAGQANFSGDYAFVGGGSNNKATGHGSFIGGGGYDGVTTSGNIASGGASVVIGGLQNKAVNNYDAVSGGANNTASGGSANVGGGFGNSAIDVGTTVAGGSGNQATVQYAYVGGGAGNAATVSYATIGGGSNNVASTGAYATVGGGTGNVASNNSATVGGGNGNTASGTDAAVPGGASNVASGNYSTAIGLAASAPSIGQFAQSAGSFNFATPGDAQTSVYVLRGTMPAGGGTVTLSLDGGGTEIAMIPNSSYAFRIMIVAMEQNAGVAANSATFIAEGNALDLSGGGGVFSVQSATTVYNNGYGAGITIITSGGPGNTWHIKVKDPGPGLPKPVTLVARVTTTESIN